MSVSEIGDNVSQLMFGANKRRRRRSEMRLGVQRINYQTTSARPALSITPLLKFWQMRGARLVGIFILALLGWCLYALFSTTLFFVYGADISGNVAVSSREIYAISGIDSQSIFWIGPDKAVERILTLPNIKSASVSVALPARVSITVVERRPELLWETDEMVWWVDQEGTIVPPKGNIEGMLRIIDDDRKPLEAGYQIDPTIIQGAQTLQILAPEVSVIRYSRSHGLNVATPDGWPVYLGDGSQIKAKLVVLTRLLTDLKERNITPAYIDLGDPLRPVYRPNAIIQIGEPVKNNAQPTAVPSIRP
jgi:cell division septal protein FtsQ